MRFRTLFLGVLVFVACATPGETAEAVPADVGGCPMPESWAVPAQALTLDAPHAVEVPLIPNPSVLERDAAGQRGLRFQEILATSLEPGPATLTGLSLRLDASTPLDAVPADLCWSVEVRLGVSERPITDPSPWFDENFATMETQVYDGPLCLASAQAPTAPGVGEALQIVFTQPFPYDPARGHLVVDVTVDGIAGEDEAFLLDATTDPSVVSIVSLDGNEAPMGDVVPGGPVVVVDGVPGVSAPGLPEVCVGSLNLTPRAREILLRRLEWADRAAHRDHPRSARRAMRRYLWSVDRLEWRGEIPPEVAAHAHATGAEAAYAFLAPSGMAEGLGAWNGFTAALTLMSLPELVGPQLPPDSPADRALRDMEWLTGQILADGQVDGSDADAVDDWGNAFRRLLRRGWRFLSDGTRSLLRDAWRGLEDLSDLLNDPLFRLYMALLGLIDDGVIDKSEVGELQELQKLLEEQLEGLPEGEMKDLIEQLPRLLGELAALLESGDLVRITVQQLEDGSWVFVFGTDGTVQLKLFEKDVDTESWYGETTLRLFARIRDAAIRWVPTDDGHVIEVIPVDPDGTIELDLDSTGWFVVWYLSDLLGLDLDELQVTKIIYADDGIVVEGESDEGQPVRIELKGGHLRVEVNGKQTFPAPGN